MGAIAVDIGGTKIASAVFDDAGDVREKDVTAIDGRTGAAVGELVALRATEMRRAAETMGVAINGVGVSVPGIAYPETGRVWAPNIAGWDHYPLEPELRSAVGGELPVRLAGDRACYILGEAWQGSAAGCLNAIFLAIGTGIGAGILVDGRILRGQSDISGAVGWMALDRPHQPEYAACGCFEYHASGSGLATAARERAERDRNYAGSLRGAAISARDVFDAYADGDPVADTVIDEAVVFWGMAAANLISLLNPEKIIFGGGVFGPATRLLGRIRDEAARWAQPIAMQEVTLESARLGDDAGLYGAARLILIE